MSRYFSSKFDRLTPYTPGEQPSDLSRFVKLNTNESPFPPSEAAMECARGLLRPLNLYSDTACGDLRRELAAIEHVDPDELIMTNGSDEVLDYAFACFCDREHPAAFADITYGFYPVFAQRNLVPYTVIPLKDDMTLDPEDYTGIGKTIFIANPNAPTGITLSADALEKIIASNPDNVVVVDEAYADFSGVTCVPLIRKYPNLLVTRTFSKSRSLAGGRLGYGIACKELIRDLETFRYSLNPYNINSMTIAAGIAVLRDEETVRANIAVINANRAYTSEELTKRGFRVLPSGANFVFAMHPDIPGGVLYEKLKDRGILVRHFTAERIREYNRITVGTKEQMDLLLAAVDEIRKEN